MSFIFKMCEYNTDSFVEVIVHLADCVFCGVVRGKCMKNDFQFSLEF